ncbi:MAG: hypothetical protein WCL02_06400 [bacterium]
MMSLMVNPHSLGVSGWENVGIPTAAIDGFVSVGVGIGLVVPHVVGVADGGVVIHFSFSILEVFGQNLR